jgi:hypothetical protein
MHTTSRRILASAAATVAILLITSCGGDDDKPKAAPTTSATPASSAPPAPQGPTPEEQAREQVLAAYQKVGDVTDQVASDGRVGNQDVSGFMSGQAKVKWAAAGLNMEQQGTKVTGKVTRVAQVTALTLSAAPPTASVQACLDTSAIKLVRADTGAPVSTQPQASRYVQTATAEFRDGRWLIVDFVSERNRSC